ncbi:MAG: endonuclease MutS2 [Clostridia bacterium]|nr:endonuclease MutS2 [Clostridia bacterium]
MERKYLDKIDYFEIAKNLSNYAITSVGKEICFSLFPCADKEKVKHMIKETTEAITLKYRKGNPPISEIANINNYIKTLKSNSSLTSIALLNLATILKISRELKMYISENVELENIEIINKYFENLYSNNKIENAIFTSIIDENSIDDKASSTLNNIRKSKKKLEGDIKKSLSSLLNSKYIQEPIVTIRNDRYVIPVKNEYRNEIKGFIHDISSSGSTVFIEPFSVFDLNNQLNTLRLKENIEIEKILYNLSSLFFNITEELENNVRLISMIDFAFAKANYAISIEATEPIINDEKFINLKLARHPLIPKEIVVPININIGKNYNTLVITGPNTGGKTVTLKTVVLLTCMAMSGLYIPTAEHSSIYVFKNIFVDIGDEQSISESLSTFSSHMTNIVEITDNADDESLIVLDELGSGTDPVQGANLGISILDYLNTKNSITLTTTHYPEIKHYALVTDNFENASSEFDLDSLSPTYRLLIGIPGKSMAFEIAEKLGLNSQILKNAKSNLSSNNISIEELLKNIYDDKVVIEKEKENILASSSEITELKNKLKSERIELENSKKDILYKAKLEARDILINAKEDANSIIKELSTSRNIENLRKNLNKKIQELDINDISTNAPITSVNIGMKVYIPTLNQEGTILSMPNKDNLVNIQVGNAKMHIPLNKLESSTVPTNTKSNITYSHTATNLKTKFVSQEINVIGYNVDEAIFVIDKFLDDCSIAKIQTARIVHGKGTGALRKGIHNFLKNHPHVASFRLGTFGEGEMGVTVVEIK